MLMPLSRRSAIRQFLFVSAGMALIPSCLQDKSKPAVELKNFSISADQDSLLAELAESHHSQNNNTRRQRYFGTPFCFENDG